MVGKVEGIFKILKGKGIVEFDKISLVLHFGVPFLRNLGKFHIMLPILKIGKMFI